MGPRKGPSCSKVAKMLTCNFAFFSQNVQSDPAEKRRGGVHHQVRYEHPFQGCYIYSGW